MSTALRLLPPGPALGGAIILRPDWSARRAAVVDSPANLAGRAGEAFARALSRRPAPASSRKIAAGMAAIARGIKAASPSAPLHKAPPAAGAASWQPVAFVDPSAGLAALSASLAAVTAPQAAR